VFSPTKENTMSILNYLLLAVRNPQESAHLYTQILGATPVQSSESFVLYALPTGLKVGLWAASDMTPAPTAAGGVEISFSEPDKDAVRATHAAWKQLGLPIAQEPTDMDFGFTFVAVDPDGHRLRVFTLSENPR
jgi:catechol 2,3-dioxygenase-like lactoylglutathione lyase family enzyme